MEVTVSAMNMKLSPKEVARIVDNWIGTDGGYLGIHGPRFSYASHDRFWRQVCDLEVDTRENNRVGHQTTREYFESLLLSCPSVSQASVLRELLELYQRNPEVQYPRQFRTAQFEREMSSWLGRLETGQTAVEVQAQSAGVIVREALDQADTLLRTHGSQSAVDRVHTALHAYLREVAKDIPGLPERPRMVQLLKALQNSHPQFPVSATEKGVEDALAKVLNSLGNILESLDSLRNNASQAHAGRGSLEEPEAWLVLNTVRTLLNYFDAKLFPHSNAVEAVSDAASQEGSS